MATTFNKPKSIAGLDRDERRAALVNGGTGGSTGSGLPAGGTADQVLVKVDAVDGNAEWRDPAASSTLSGVASVDLGYPAVFSKTVNVVDANVTALSRMVLGWGLTTDLDVNDGEMDQVTFHPKPKAGSFDLTVSSTQRLGGVFKVAYILA
jgi:hypothetical protein